MRGNLAVLLAVSVGVVAVATAWTLAGCQSSCCMGGSAQHMDCCGIPQGSQAGMQPTTAPAKIVNARCPMMGGVIDPAKVPASLTREYKGQTVAFCCGGCPDKWDKLTDAEKDARLAKVLVK